MRYFFKFFQIILLLIIFTNPVLIIYFNEIFYHLSLYEKVFFLWLATFVEFLLIIFLINKSYHGPLLKLEYLIKSFIVWNLKDNDIKFKKTLNPHLNYTLLFFSKTLNTLKNIKQEFLHGKTIKSEVEIAKEIQWKILEKKLETVPSLDIVIKSKPAWEIWWDSFDIVKQNDNFYIYVWDATGHGVWAWFIMVMVNALISWFTKIYKSGADVLSKTNEILKPRIKANLLMSLLLVRWNEKEKRLFMTWAWHEYLMIYKHKQQKTFRIKSGWVALWMIKNISKLLKEKEISFEKNDVAILYSDWITEAINKPARNWEEAIFWEQRLEEAINSSPNVSWKDYKSARSIFNNISINLSKFMWYKHVQLDDVTLAVIHYKGDDYDKSKDYKEEIPNEFITERNW